MEYVERLEVTVTRLLSALILSAGLLAAPAGAVESTRTVVVPGVELVQTIVSAQEAGGPQLIHALVVDPSRPGIRLAAGLGNGTVEEPGSGREPLNEQVLRTGALAGVNADFFPWTGDPLGLAIHKGELVSEPSGGRSAAWGITRDGKSLIGQPEFAGFVTAAEGSGIPLSTSVMALSGVNRKPGQGQMVLFSPIYGAQTPDAPATVVALDAPGATLAAGVPLVATVVSVKDETGATPTRPGGFVLTGTGAAAEWLKAHAVPNKTLTINVDVNETGKDWTQVVEAVAGGPTLLSGGAESAQLIAGKKDSFSTTRHPRTAVGVTKDGKVILAVVDGRQTLSRGMSLPELAQAMKDLGAVEALNLDGGGSSALSVLGMVISSPSDGTVRSVADSLLVFAADAPSPWSVTTSSEAMPTVTAGKTLARPKDADTARLFGSANGGIFVDQTGTIYGYKGGPAAALALSKDGKTITRQPVEVLPGPAGKILTAWKDGTLVVTVRDTNNNAVQGQEVQLKQPDGRMTEITTGADGTVAVKKGWLKDEKSPVTLTSGVMSTEWPQKK